MSDEQRGAGDGREAGVKVSDRRRFTAEGDPVETNEGASAGTATAERQPAALPAPDDRDDKIAAQAARIDELARAYATLVEDNKAFRARLEREKDRTIAAERGEVLRALLEAVDELERALAATAAAPEEARPGVLATLVEGVRLTLASLSKRIAELGAARYEVVGQPFDPRTAEAVDVIPVSDESQDEIVLQEIRPGYRLGDRILRPARVRVGRLARA